ncbi:MAG: hypothetical protein JSS34_08495 [Proteobacteria bacterium]|nr:hypothetical protein [Pseudomonadota bacterium]
MQNKFQFRPLISSIFQSFTHSKKSGFFREQSMDLPKSAAHITEGFSGFKCENPYNWIESRQEV